MLTLLYAYSFTDLFKRELAIGNILAVLSFGFFYFLFLIIKYETYSYYENAMAKEILQKFLVCLKMKFAS